MNEGEKRLIVKWLHEKGKRAAFQCYCANRPFATTLRPTDPQPGGPVSCILAKHNK